MARQIKTSDLEAGAHRTWAEVAKEFNRREGLAIPANQVREIGCRAITRLRKWIEKDAELKNTVVNEDDWRV